MWAAARGPTTSSRSSGPGCAASWSARTCTAIATIASVPRPGASWRQRAPLGRVQGRRRADRGAARLGRLAAQADRAAAERGAAAGAALGAGAPAEPDRHRRRRTCRPARSSAAAIARRRPATTRRGGPSKPGSATTATARRPPPVEKSPIRQDLGAHGKGITAANARAMNERGISTERFGVGANHGTEI